MSAALINEENRRGFACSQAREADNIKRAPSLALPFDRECLERHYLGRFRRSFISPCTSKLRDSVGSVNTAAFPFLLSFQFSLLLPYAPSLNKDFPPDAIEPRSAPDTATGVYLSHSGRCLLFLCVCATAQRHLP